MKLALLHELGGLLVETLYMGIELLLGDESITFGWLSNVIIKVGLDLSRMLPFWWFYSVMKRKYTFPQNMNGETHSPKGPRESTHMRIKKRLEKHYQKSPRPFPLMIGMFLRGFKSCWSDGGRFRIDKPLRKMLTSL